MNDDLGETDSSLFNRKSEGVVVLDPIDFAGTKEYNRVI
jgi:hypothetical protein